MARGDIKEGYGFLFPVKAEDRRENGPAMTGKFKKNGTEYQIAGWTKTAQSGVKYLSLKVQLPGEGMPDGANGGQEAAQVPLDDDIPF